jgi:chemotaxis protein methyltransferase CheR
MLSESLLGKLKICLEQQTGLNFFGKGWQDFENRITSAANAAGVSNTLQYIDQLLGQPLSQTQIHELARHLTISETYFFRDQHCFDALATRVFPEILKAREASDQKRLRILSAGCCTGEEAYSIAILLDQLLPHQQHWDIQIVGTDINPQAIQKAQEAIYSEWSFRTAPDWVKKQYFVKTRQGNFELCAKIRERVQFTFANLAKNIYPASTTNAPQFDAIFCRNVLMYFSTEQARSVIMRFQESLCDDGFLLVSPTETSAALFRGFKPVNYPGAIFYYKEAHVAQLDKASKSPVRKSPINRHSGSGASVRELVNKPPLQRSRRNITSATTAKTAKPDHVFTTGEPSLPASNLIESSNSPEVLATRARQCANQGQLEEAVNWCLQAIAAEKQNPALHYLLASIEQERGATAAAIKALQRTLYLDQNFVLAHFALANLRLVDGRRNDAARHLDIVRKLLKNYPADEVLPDTDNLTVGHLDEIAVALSAGLTDSKSIKTVGR